MATDIGAVPKLSPETLRQQEEERRWVDSLLVSAQKRGWYGKIIIEVKRGMIDVVAKTETLKPPLADT